ncbi:TonB-dependent receptor [Algibacillus agarilyticus]|uniref:TonB-dependent receptor n=1 Tax=Algibacillus agarilyticus TaxID=2234133 RepID=UPI000DD07927|nr:TonB-dependent receptor [Algibacillus agarilyticus]
MLKHNKIHSTHFKKSLLALAIISSSTTPLYAAEEENAESEVEVIEVRGMKRSLMNAADIKRSADTFVDAISADDIGALPDRSVLEAMQRIPGISIERFAAADDPDHFGVEGSGAVIRGMSQTRSEFNGRDSFSANSGRGLSFQDVPPELMSSVRVYKNQSADMIEGGIGGTVSLHTRTPFESDDELISISGDITYNDLSETTEPSLSALYSNNWMTDIGKVGFLANIANSHVQSRSDSLQSEVFLHRDDLVEGETVITPNGGNIGTKVDERERFGLALAGQWESLDKTTLVTAQFMRSDASLAWTENTISYQTNMYADDGSLRRDSAPLEGIEGAEGYTYDSSGMFTSGYITDTAGGGWRSNGNDSARVPNAADWAAPNNMPQFGNIHQTTTRIKQQKTVVDDMSLNIKFRPDDTWSHEVDFQFIQAETKDDDVTLYLAFYANQYLDLTADVPFVGYLNPWNGAELGGDKANDDAFMQDKSNYHWRSAMDHAELSEGESVAAKYDVKYMFDDGFFKSVKAGVRFAEREQTVRYSKWNWDPIGAIHSTDVDDDGFAGAWVDLPANESIANETMSVDWSDHHRGGTTFIGGDGTSLHPSLALVENYQRMAEYSAAWVPLDQRQIQSSVDANGNPVYEELDGQFRPAEINTFVETNTAAYVRLDFETEIGDIPIDGNFGLRYVQFEREGQGAISFPNLFPEDPTDEGDRLNALPQAQKDFGNYAYQPIATTHSFDDVLPSLNLKAELNDDLVARFAVSKALAYPDTGVLKSYVSISDGAWAVEREQAEDEGVDPDNLKVISAEIKDWQGNSGNPYLNPMESIQMDLSLEWYFDETDSMTISLFNKDLTNFWVTTSSSEEYTNNGTSAFVNVQKPLNMGEGKMTGVEFSYQQFFDSLPAPFDGLGMQFNYSNIQAKGIPTSNLFNTSPDGAPSTGGEAALEFDDLPMKGQSEHTANLIAMYEKDAFSARLAYNWRSDYLITVRDVIAPYRPVYSEAAGYLDGNMFYNISDSIKVGIQGVNLLDTVSKTTMQIDNEGNTAGRSWFVNDRRISFVVRANF